jgi:hypothetical protein
MADPQEFPLPEVAEALGPFIRPRNEIAQIRKELQNHVQSQLKSGDAPLATTNLANPTEGELPDVPTSSLTGVRRAYLKALQAHATAQSRYEALKADLARLQTGTTEDHTKPKEALVHESYIPLLRQRERQRKLLVLDSTFAQIHAAGKGVVDGHLDDVVRQQAGDLPTPPSTQPSAFNEKPDVNARILELKKAILSTKRSIDAPKSGPSSTQSVASSKSMNEPEIAGLQHALNELTGWMEHQLAIIGETEAEAAQSAPPTPSANGQVGDTVPTSLDDVEVLYEQYLEARQRLIETSNDPPESKFDPISLSPIRERSSAQGSSRSSAAETILPFIPSLVSSKQQEASLLQQGTHIRRAITTAEAETLRLISRLADESHLVHPGASKCKDWADAANEAGKATKEAALQRVRAGQDFAGAAEWRMKEVEKLPEALEELSGK